IDHRTYLVESIEHAFLEHAAYPVVWDYETVHWGTCDEEMWFADATYYVVYDYTVGSGGKLIIEPGTVVKFITCDDGPSINFCLSVQGTGVIIAKGEPYMPIVFTSVFDNTNGEIISFSDLPSREDHGGLEIGRGSVFEFCRVLYAYKGVSLVDEGPSGEVMAEVQHNIFTECETAVDLSDADEHEVNIFNNLIYSSGTGIRDERYDFEKEDVAIGNNTFDEVDYGIYLNVAADEVIRSNLFTSCVEAGVRSQDVENELIIYYNGFWNNESDVINVSLEECTWAQENPYHGYDNTFCGLGYHYLNHNYHGGDRFKNAGYGSVEYAGYEKLYEWAIYHVPGDNIHGFHSNITINTDTEWKPDESLCDTGTVAIGYHHPRIDYFIDHTQVKVEGVGSQKSVLEIYPGTVIVLASNWTEAFNNNLLIENSGVLKSLGLPDTYEVSSDREYSYIVWGDSGRVGQISNTNYIEPLGEPIQPGDDMEGCLECRGDYQIVFNKFLGLVSCAALFINGEGVQYDNCIIRDSIFGVNYWSGVYFYKCDQYHSCQNCLFYQNEEVGIISHDSDDFLIKNCTFETSDEAIDFKNSGNTYIKFNIFSREIYEGSWGGDDDWSKGSASRTVDRNMTFKGVGEDDINDPCQLFASEWYDYWWGNNSTVRFEHRYSLNQKNLYRSARTSELLKSGAVDYFDPKLQLVTIIENMYGYTTDYISYFKESSTCCREDVNYKLDAGFHLPIPKKADGYNHDWDGDKIPNYEEYWLGTNPYSTDTDFDNLSEFYEIFILGSDPLSGDTDGDGRGDYFEWKYSDYGFDLSDPGEDMGEIDSDGDGMADEWEDAFDGEGNPGLEPEEDLDGDGLSNYKEFLNYADPSSADTDEDGIDDLGEVDYGFNPAVADAEEDDDGDGFCNIMEYFHGSNPHQVNNLNQIPRARYAVPREVYNVQDIIDNGWCLAGDVLVLPGGTYYETINISGMDITLTSSNPDDPGSVTINADTAGPTVTFSDADGSRLIGITLTGGSTSGVGGGVRGDGSEVEIINCIIKANEAANGGGIANISGTIANCIISDNSASSAGGGLYNCAGEIINCTIVKNEAGSNGGGLAYCEGQITNCIIWGNTISSGIDNQMYNCATPSFSDIQEDGLISYWKLDENSGTNAANAVGGEDGDLINMDGSEWDSGKLGNGLEFDGTEDYIDCNTDFDIDDFGGVNGKITIAAWVRPDDVEKYNAITRFFGGVHYFSAGTDQTGYEKKLRTMVRDVAHGSNYWPTSDGTIEAEEWTHVVFIFEGGVGYKFYIDGELDKSESNSDLGMYNYSTSQYIGNNPGGSSGSYFDGMIDDVRIYNRILSDLEVQQMYLNGLAGRCVNGQGNIIVAPQFINWDEGDYHLADVESPGVDAGNPFGVYEGRTDIEGEPRLTGLGVDMGADEVVSTNIRYVDKNADGSGTGASWEDAFTTINAAISAANDEDTIIVARGDYFENIEFNGKNIILTSTNPKDDFIVKNTIINGGGNGSVVTFDGTECSYCQLFGFTITGGIGTEDTSATYGGGILGNGCKAIISHCIIKNNSADIGGGLNNCDGQIINCLICGNSVEYFGGGLCGCDGPITNCTIVNNAATNTGSLGGGVWGGGGSITNCIIWGNTDNNSSTNAEQEQIYVLGESPTVTYCCIQDDSIGGSIPFGGSDNNNIDKNPEFIEEGYWEGSNWVMGHYQLRTDSPCIDAGDDAAATYIYMDLDGRVRIRQGKHNIDGGSETVDMGAYEAARVWYVDRNASGDMEDQDGQSWENAYRQLYTALDEDHRDLYAEGDEIWVAAIDIEEGAFGSYKPAEESSQDRSATFRLVEGVGIYGGFKGDEEGGAETARGDRNWEAEKTILDGRLYEDSNSGENDIEVYHVVTGAHEAILDGFVVRYGDAAYESDADKRKGGGILIDGSGFVADYFNPVMRCEIVNCFINHNVAGAGGGISVSDAEAVVRHCDIRFNIAEKGGGMFINNSSSCVTNTLFAINMAVTRGAAGGYGGRCSGWGG
ncbi:MAG: hypothetical protein AMJ79_11265, partial [Phycisphaerae bacterium SM23_30]